MKTINRREWLKAGLVFSSLLATNPSSALPTIKRKPVLNHYTGQWTIPAWNKEGIRLGSNENPYGPSKSALEALQKALTYSNRYAYKQAEELKLQIAEMHGVSPEHIMLGAGSMELLTVMGLVFGAREGAILTAFPTFEPLMRVMTQLNCEWQQVDVNENGETDLDAIANSANIKTRLVYIVNPNNPTGTVSDPEKLKSFCRSMTQKVPVFVDEAYNEFLDDNESQSMISLIKEDVPVTVTRTLSKIHGFAGLRIGYLVAPVPLIARLKVYRPHATTLSGPSIAAAKAALKDEAFIKLTREKNAESMAFTVERLKAQGYNCFNSNTNFVFFPLKMSGEDFIGKMDDNGIQVAAWTYKDKSWGRVSLGTMDEMKTFVDVMKKIS